MIESRSVGLKLNKYASLSTIVLPSTSLRLILKLSQTMNTEAELIDNIKDLCLEKTNYTVLYEMFFLFFLSCSFEFY